jgi:hypothetical protein
MPEREPLAGPARREGEVFFFIIEPGTRSLSYSFRLMKPVRIHPP